METILELEYTLDKNYKVSTNEIYAGIHWTKRKRISDYFHNLVQLDCKKLKQFDCKVDIEFIFTFNSRSLDSSNCSYMAKCMEDGFRKGGLLIDDNNKYVGRFTTYSQKGEIDKIYINFYKNDGQI